MSKLRVALDARLQDGDLGGVQQFIIGLVSGLGQLENEGEEYLLMMWEEHQDWITPYLTDQFRVITEPRHQNSPRFPALRRVVRSVPGLAEAWRRRPTKATPLDLPQSTGLAESEGAQVIHFTTQKFFHTTLPFIYQPHDLQHVHLPEFFSPQLLESRDYQYRTGCDEASMVVASSTWVRDDLIHQYSLSPGKVAVVPLAPVLNAYPDPSEPVIAEIRERLGLPIQFLYYPAQTWPHKNHISLLKAIAKVRERSGVHINLVFSGSLNIHASTIKSEVKRLNLEDQVTFVGFVEPIELQALYKACLGVVIPTKFEAASFPMWEAFEAKAPVACSNVTSLPRQAGNAAIVFDPYNIDEIANAVYTLWTDSLRRDDLIKKGSENVAQFTWVRTARAFRAIYRQTAGHGITAMDREILAAEPLL